MISYRDRVYCLYWSNCKQGEGCSRAFTKEVSKAADEWWGGPGAPISFFSSEPDCFKQVDDTKN